MIVLPKYVIKIMNTQTVFCMVHIIVLIFIPVHLRNTVNLKGQQIEYKIFSLRDTYSYCIMLFIWIHIFYCLKSSKECRYNTRFSQRTARKPKSPLFFRK